MTKKQMDRIRGMTDEELYKRYLYLNSEIAKFRAGSKRTGGPGGMIKLPMGKEGVNWGLFQRLKREKAQVLTVMNQRSNRVMARKKHPGRRYTRKELMHG